MEFLWGPTCPLSPQGYNWKRHHLGPTHNNRWWHLATVCYCAKINFFSANPVCNTPWTLSAFFPGFLSFRARPGSAALGLVKSHEDDCVFLSLRILLPGEDPNISLAAPWAPLLLLAFREREHRHYTVNKSFASTRCKQEQCKYAPHSHFRPGIFEASCDR